MDYISTRDHSRRVSAAEAIVKGLSPDGGLFVPETIPAFGEGELEKLLPLDYPALAAEIMGRYLTDFTREELEEYTRAAYGPGRFDSTNTAPLRRGREENYLELWHGPTCAFKDMALQILPYLLSASIRKCGETKTVSILVATSGDTGKAALEGFRDVPGTRIMVFYPESGVSDIQKLQMVSQAGENVNVMAVKGNFDDAQSGVKRIFGDAALNERLSQAGFALSSANSINWGRLLPQIVYYVWSYLRLAEAGELKLGDPVDFTVPTGNFGDILAGWYALKMGLPVGRLVCASNRNDVLTEFIDTGVYSRLRPFHLTSSPSMDILISSNLERLLFWLSGKNDSLTRAYMEKLNREGRYTADSALMEKLRLVFAAESVTEEGTLSTIRRLWEEEGVLIDPHTAVAAAAARRRKREGVPMVVVSTASPYKFSHAVLHALGDDREREGMEAIAALEERTGVRPPEPIAALKNARVRFTKSCEPPKMESAVLEFLK